DKYLKKDQDVRKDEDLEKDQDVRKDKDFDYIEYEYDWFLPYEQADKSLSNEKADNNTKISSYKCKISKSSFKENIGITLEDTGDTSDPLIIRKYIIYTAILWLRMKTKYQFKIEPIVMTEEQRNEL
ncbi:15864_t:CDS:2, partial [Racocetra fulgida]